MRAPIGEEERAEIAALLEWLAADHFTFLGYREYRRVSRDGRDWLEAVPGTGLGILRDELRPSRPRPLDTLAVPSGEMQAAADALILTKTNARSLVHRPGYMDYIGLLEFDERGRPVGERRFVGLYTSSAYNRRPWEIPLIRRRFEAVMRRSGLAPEGHSGKALRHILETLPRDELFQASVEELERIAIGILNLQERQRTRLFLRRDRYGRFFSCLAFLPRDRFNTAVRQRIEELLMRALEGERCDTQVMVGESLARPPAPRDPAAARRAARDLRRPRSRPRSGASSATGSTICASDWSRATARNAASNSSGASVGRCRQATSSASARNGPRSTSRRWAGCGIPRSCGCCSTGSSATRRRRSGSSCCASGLRSRCRTRCRCSRASGCG
ncbi:MAG: NAD-glutamate dehydrogenase [Xanthomonadales bacterium]|nr:NAD-glutamate dehydrogenase [Xanthomonadales bacterium]